MFTLRTVYIRRYCASFFRKVGTIISQYVDQTTSSSLLSPSYPDLKYRSYRSFSQSIYNCLPSGSSSREHTGVVLSGQLKYTRLCLVGTLLPSVSGMPT